EVSDFSALFQDSKRSDFSGIEDWDVSHVTNMRNMFRGAVNFNSDISSWDVSNVRDMSYMFYDANSFNQSLDNWDVSNVKNMENMFFSVADVVNTFAGLFGAKQQLPNKKRLPKWYKE
ncbi:BspA family leucine-rich repeat surface protein, partial [Helicobacter colisuis]|uniref:BspA family leucine-rich repeat surface protein n=1 Tax=Helicobacter colisuis TaxID=2949739 RepID=UPI00202A16BD